MNCDECNEQVLELIEREAVDRDGVREILARCPECRAAFDELKAVLLAAEQLPIEQPPVELDATILRAAGARVPEEVPVKKRRLQPAPWAMAAIAMLAVGVGVWTIPQEAAFEGDVAPADERPAPGMNAPARAFQLAKTEAKKGQPEPQRAKRRARLSENEPRAGGQAPAPASVAMADGAQASVCELKIDETERRARADEDYAPTPDEELAIGKCYQELDNVTEARKWLERAATHRKTKAAAKKALRQLAPE
ncbi:MAG: hypothetical protein JRF42_18425 [Deltaproteobacteria bacterium]|nr:hypothetical protein [Deltaproteobacteria bacterium]